MRTIRVTGTGNVAVTPDLIQTNITISGIKKKYKDAVEESAKNGALLKEAVSRASLDPKNLKTVKFNVSPYYERYQDKDNNWKQKFTGYQFTHQFVIEFDNNNEILGKMMYELANYGNDARFSFSYTVKDIETVKTQLLRNAVADSKRKAEIIAGAAKVGLKQIEHIDYSWGEVRMFSSPISMPQYDFEESSMMRKSRSYDIDIEADDIRINDTVTIVWSID